MESDNAQTGSPETKTKPKKHPSTLVKIAILTIVILIAATFVYTMLPKQNTTQNQTNTDWYFKGAYAAYEGEATYLSETMSFSMRMEVADLNSTHLKTLFQMKMTTQTLGTLFDEQETSWVKIEETTSLGLNEIEGYILDRSYEDHVYVEGIGTKYCKIYEYSSAETDYTTMSMTIYVDPDMKWPVKFTFHMTIEDEEIVFNINLKETNISALD